MSEGVDQLAVRFSSSVMQAVRYAEQGMGDTGTEVSVKAGRRQVRVRGSSDSDRTIVGRSLADGLLLALTATLVFLQPRLRQEGVFALAALAAFALAYGLVFAPRRIIAPLVLFTTSGALWVALSYLDALPDSWTSYYVRDLIPRQAAYLVLLYPLCLAFFAMWDNTLRRGQESLVFSMLVCAAVSGEIAFGSSSLLSAVQAVTLSGLGNAKLPLFMGIGYLFLNRLTKHPLRVAIGSLCAGMIILIVPEYNETKSQNIAALALLALFSTVRPTKYRTVLLLAASVLVYVVAMMFPVEVYRVDPNSGYRVCATRHSLEGLWGSYGLGVGFGKEVVRTYVPELNVERNDIAATVDSVVVQGVHNSYAEELMRLGVIGGLCVVYFFLVYLFPCVSAAGDFLRLSCYTYVLLFMVLMVNVALESPSYLVGVAFATGYLLAVKEAAKRRAHAR